MTVKGHAEYCVQCATILTVFGVFKPYRELQCPEETPNHVTGMDLTAKVVGQWIGSSTDHADGEWGALCYHCAARQEYAGRFFPVFRLAEGWTSR